MDAFFGITLSILVLYKWLRSESKKPDQSELNRNTVKARWDRKRLKAEKQKTVHKTAATKQSDAELISVIIPTINHDK